MGFLVFESVLKENQALKRQGRVAGHKHPVRGEEYLCTAVSRQNYIHRRFVKLDVTTVYISQRTDLTSSVYIRYQDSCMFITSPVLFAIP